MASANTYELESSSGWGSKHPCKVCGEQTKTMHRLFYYPTFMNGDAEWIADYCDKHKSDGNKELQKLEASIKATEKKERELQAKRDQAVYEKLQRSIQKLRSEGFDVKDLNHGYQYRINESLDVFPTNKLFHDLKRNRRGNYHNLLEFATTFFNPIDEKNQPF